MSTVTDKQIFDTLRDYIKPMQITQAVVTMVNKNMQDPVKKTALLDALGLQICASKLYNLNATTLKAIYPGADTKAINFILKYAPVFGIVYKKDMATFLANTLVESMGFHAQRESFNYKPARLLAVFPTRIKTLGFANQLVAKGQKAIADHLYGGRYGNGPDEGYMYRGNSWIQLTFKNNYELCKVRTGVDIVTHPELAQNMDVAAISSMDFWHNNGCSELAEGIRNSNLTAVRKAINGGSNSLEEVTALYLKAMKVL